MQDIHLISHHLCPYVQRAVIVLREKGIDHRRTYIDLADKPDWFASVSPLGKVPVLETKGHALFESQVIAEYLDEITVGILHPDGPLEKAHHRSWIEFGSERLKAIGAFYSAPDAESFTTREQVLYEKLARIEREVQGPFFAGENFHMVDGVWGTIFRYFDTFERLLDRPMLQGLPLVEKWRQEIAARASVIAAVPAEYDQRLEIFLRARKSHIAALIKTPELVLQ